MDTTEPTGLGSREHVRATIARARAAIRASQAHATVSRTLLGRAELLTETSERAVRESLGLQQQLRDSVVAYVRRLKTDGLPAERVLVLVKSAVREAAASELAPVEVRRLMEDVVRWSVEAYYPAA